MDRKLPIEKSAPQGIPLISAYALFPSIPPLILAPYSYTVQYKASLHTYFGMQNQVILHHTCEGKGLDALQFSSTILPNI